MNGSNQCSGRVEFHYGGRWAAAYNVNWGRNEAAVVCREMNCGDPVKFSGSFGRGGLGGYKVTCVGGERSLSQCTVGQYPSNNRIEDAGVECSGKTSLSFIVQSILNYNSTATIVYICQILETSSF